MNKLPAPKGYVSWLRYAIDKMDVKRAFSDDSFTDRKIPTRDEIRAAAQAELDQLQPHSSDDGPLTEKQVAALCEDAAQHLPIGKTTGKETLFDGYHHSPEDFVNEIDKGLESELGDLADAAKGAAERASLAIDDALRFIEESNSRIADLGKGTALAVTRSTA